MPSEVKYKVIPHIVFQGEVTTILTIPSHVCTWVKNLDHCFKALTA